MLRRAVLQTITAAVSSGTGLFRQRKPPRILLRSAWQTVNIGDIAHTPGVLRLIEDHIPDAEVTLWPGNIGGGVQEILRSRFPKLKFAQSEKDVTQAMRDCDFLLHGSGPSLVGQKQVERWISETGKPFGVYGITLATISDALRDLLTQARFVFFRDSVSLELAQDRGVRSPVMAFGPDGAFAVDLQNDDAAQTFLKANRLEPGRFVCCIPRLRHTPYWKIRNKPMTPEDDRKHVQNEEMKEHDHAPLRAAISAIVRETPYKVLVCPEDQSQMVVGKELLIDKLPADIQQKVVWRESFWLTDEAISTYRQSAGLFGLEMHSPIMCIGNGVPAIVGRFAEQTSKGFMWKDIGLSDWLFDFDKPEDVARYPSAVLAMVRDRETSLRMVKQAQQIVADRQQATLATLAQELNRTA